MSILISNIVSKHSIHYHMVITLCWSYTQPYIIMTFVQQQELGSCLSHSLQFRESVICFSAWNQTRWGMFVPDWYYMQIWTDIWYKWKHEYFVIVVIVYWKTCPRNVLLNVLLNEFLTVIVTPFRYFFAL